MQARPVKRDDGGGLSLGALIAIALCGGIALFTGVGLLMAWTIRLRQRKSSARPYTIPDEYSQTRLTKRPLVMTESAVSGFSSHFSSRFSLALPPIIPLPPMPSYTNFNFFRSPGRRKGERRRSWVGGNHLHGPQVSRDATMGWWSGKDVWYGQAPTYPTFSTGERTGREADKDSSFGHARQGVYQQPYYEEYRKQQQRQQPQLYEPPESHLHLSQYHHGPYPPMVWDGHSQTEKEVVDQKAAAAAADDDAPRGRNSAVRVPAQAHLRQPASMTDQGLRDILRSTDQRLREGTSRSPVKETHHGSSPSRGSPVKTHHSRRSNSTARGPGRQSRGTTPSPRKGSGGSIKAVAMVMATSTTQTSILSAASAADSLIAEATQQLELPGGTASPSRLRGREWEPREDQILPPSGPGLESPLLRTPTQSPTRSPSRSTPQRRSSVDSDQSSSLSTLYSVGEPDVDDLRLQFQAQEDGPQHHPMTPHHQAPTADDDADPFTSLRLLPSKHQPLGPRPLRHTKSMSPARLPRNNNNNNNSSSPTSLQPLRPISANSTIPVWPTPLDPDTTLAPSISSSSFTSASVHSQDSTATTLPGDTLLPPAIKSTTFSLRKVSDSSSLYSCTDPAPLSSTIASLRRMNSVVTSYSAASIASSTTTVVDSPTIPDIFGPPNSSRHYLNIGKPKHRSLGPLRKGPSGVMRVRRRPRSDTVLRGGRGKENLGLGILRPDLMPAREHVRVSVPATPSGLVGSPCRDGHESLGLYDEEGFLLPSPDRDMSRRALHM